MAALPARSGALKANEPVVQELASFHSGSIDVPVRLVAWKLEDGSWRGRLVFGPPDAEIASTADILCAPNENDFWESVCDLREHHLRDLYRSLVP